MLALRSKIISMVLLPAWLPLLAWSDTGTTAARAQKTAATAKSSGSVAFVTWTEPREHAFSIKIPQGWTASGGTFRHSDVDVRFAVQVRSPDNRIQLFMGDDDLVARQEPHPITRQMGLREGQVYDNGSFKYMIARYLSGEQFSRQYISWKLCRNPRIKQSGSLPDITRAMTAKVAAYGRSVGALASASAGEAIFRCGESEGFARATTLLARPATGNGMAMWFIQDLSGFISTDPAQAYFAKYVLDSIIASTKFDPVWEGNTAQRGGQAAKSAMEMSNAVTQSVIAHARAQAAMGSAGGWNHPNAGVPHPTHDPDVAKRMDIARRGNKDVCDELGNCKNVSNAATCYWRDHSGNVVPGAESCYPPDYSGQWTLMK